MKVIATIQDHHLRLTPAQHSLRQRYLDSLPNGSQVTEELKRITHEKSWKQVKTIFGLAIQKILDDFEERGIGTDELLGLSIPTGNPIHKGMMKEYLYAVCPIYSEDGIRITLSHKDCTSKCASDFFKAIRNFMASQWSVYIPEPNPDFKDSKDGKDS